jgi:hypothetical protein
MAKQPGDDHSARGEAAELLGITVENMSAADVLRVDLIVSLRAVIDAEQANVLAGSSADLGKLNVAVQSLIALLPNRELPKPERDDPYDPAGAREKLWRLYKQARDNGELFYATTERQQLLDRIEALEAQLRGETEGHAPPAPSPPQAVSGDNVLPLTALNSPPAATPAPLSPRGDNSSPAAEPPQPPAKPAWETWLENGGYGGPGYDRWADNR